MAGPVSPPPTIVTANGSRIIISGTPAAGQVPTADGPNAAHWAPGGVGAPEWVASWNAVPGTGLGDAWGAGIADVPGPPNQEWGATDVGVYSFGTNISLGLAGIWTAEVYVDLAWPADPGRVNVLIDGMGVDLPVQPGPSFAARAIVPMGTIYMGGNNSSKDVSVRWDNGVQATVRPNIDQMQLQLTKWLTIVVGD